MKRDREFRHRIDRINLVGKTSDASTNKSGQRLRRAEVAEKSTFALVLFQPLICFVRQVPESGKFFRAGESRVSQSGQEPGQFHRSCFASIRVSIERGLQAATLEKTVDLIGSEYRGQPNH